MGKHLQSGWTFKIKIEIWISVFTWKVRNHGCIRLCMAPTGRGSQLLLFLTGQACSSRPQPPHVLQTLSIIRFVWICFDIHLKYTVLFLDFAVSQCRASVPLLRPCSCLTLSPLLWLPAHTPTHHEASDPGNSNYSSSLLWESFIQTACMGTPHLIVVDYFNNIFSQLDCEFVRKRVWLVFIYSAPYVFNRHLSNK